MNSQLLRSLRHPVANRRIQADKNMGYCWACGKSSSFAYEEIIHDDLARQWGVTPEQRHAYSSRESRQCLHCGATHRNRQMARALCEIYDFDNNTRSLKQLIESEKFKQLNVTEINACGGLHQFFIRLPHFIYSEYEPADPNIRSEDLHDLSYADGTFDLVATSDSLEHIPDFRKALSEIHRVLKPGGLHVFTIPVIWANTNRSRAEMVAGKIQHLVDDPAYHGPPHDDNLVWTDFGIDVLEDLKNAGFKTTVRYYNLLNKDDAGCVLVSRKLK